MKTTQINVLQFICPTGFYGAERWILALANNFEAIEHNDCKTHIHSELAVTKEHEDHNLELTKKFRDELGLPTHEMVMSGRFDLSVINKLCALIKERNIHIIHTHGYKSDILGVIAAKKAGIKSVCTPHGFENSSDLKLRAFIWSGCQSFRFFDAVVPLSRQLMDDVKGYGIKAKKLIYIQNGVDLKEVEAQRVKPMPTLKDSNVKTIGFIGQMISRKNIRDILDIFCLLKSQHPKIKLQFLGDGDARPELEDYAKTLNCFDNIEFLGFLDNRLEYLQTFDLFVMTSSLEGIPRCLMETMAMGIPVAAYNIPGIDQLITHEVSGLLADFSDTKTLKNYWEALLFDSEKATRLTDNAREFVHKEFSANRMAREYTELFASIADQ